eukprot:TRINITY_DN5439_c0_g1_i1.p2 TRINITY_DN5439_c0_g1~~TRINITY_DN5439_c0_g1_i1.p2  ORF type:complete len:252 (+),score=67.26 TRINITY_DN5439_c0_g1_i1:98-757(+)
MLRHALAATQPAARLQRQHLARLRFSPRCASSADACGKEPSPVATVDKDCSPTPTLPSRPLPLTGHAPPVHLQGATFDTLQLHNSLTAAGLPPPQAAVLTSAFSAIVRHVADGTAAAAPSKVDFASLRAELQLLEKADVATMRADVAEVERKLENAVAKLYTELERSENRTTRWVFGTAATVTALAMTFLRLSAGFSGAAGGGGGKAGGMGRVAAPPTG